MRRLGLSALTLDAAKVRPKVTPSTVLAFSLAMDKSNLAAWEIVKTAIRDYSERFHSNDSTASIEELPHQPRKVYITVKRNPNLYSPTQDTSAGIEFDGVQSITVQRSSAPGELRHFEFGAKDGRVILTDKATSKPYYVDEFCRYALAGVLFPES